MNDVNVSLLKSSPKHNRPEIRDETVHRLTEHHFPVVRANQESRGRKKTKKCRVCYGRGIKTTSGRAIEVNIVGKDCPSHPGFHVDQDCFLAYRTKLDYSGPPEELGSF